MASKQTRQKSAGRASRVLSVGVPAALNFLRHAVGLLATTAQTSRADDSLSNSIRGGVLNYREGKLDDGTDPIGWYERD